MKTGIGYLLLITVLGYCIHQSDGGKTKRKLEFSANSVELAPGENVDVILHYNHVNFSNHEFITIRVQANTNVASVDPGNITTDTNNSVAIRITGREAGYTTISAVVHKRPKGGAVVELRVFVAKSRLLKFLGIISGWLYAFAWSASFYPKLYDNYVRKNVFGLHPDCVVLNILGFAFYALYNTAMYYSPSLQDEYVARFSADIMPVELSDVIFSMHAFIASILVAFQCFFYRDAEREFKVSNPVIITSFVLTVKLLICGLLAYLNLSQWLDIVNYASLITLIASVGKFLIQGLMSENSKHQSIVGWPIEDIKFVSLHSVGGICSILQISINGYNFHDYDIIFGNLTKILLALLVINFDLLFFYKFYQMYKRNDNQYGYVQHEHPQIVDATVEENISNSYVANVVRRNDPRELKNPIIFTTNPVNNPLID